MTNHWQRWKGIMKCYPFEEKRLARWESPYIVQPKLDGERGRIIWDADGNVTMLSSEENIVTGVPHIKEEAESRGYRNLEIDGEFYRHGFSFEEIHSIVSRGESNLRDDYELMQFHTFDLVNAEPQLLRTDRLNDLPEGRAIKTVSSEIADDLEGILTCLRSFSTDGYEGVIVRNLNNFYERKRSIWMMKWKPKKEDRYLITGYAEEMDKYGQPKGTLGALLCVGGEDESFSVGSGFTREQREFLWEHRGSLPGKWIVVEYQNLTSKKGVPRFGVFKSFVGGEEDEE